MRKKLKQYLIVFLLLFIICGLIQAKPCRAASAEVIISSDSTEVTVGDRIFIYINIKSDTLFGDFEANLIYDDEVLKYVGKSPVITGDSGYLKISQMGVIEGDSSRKYTLEFEALKVGLCTIDFDDRAVVYDFDTGYEMPISSNLLTMKVKASETASTIANLKSLKISPSELSPAFDPGVFEYNTTVSSDTEQLIITALPEDTKAIVSITGNDLLKEGENKIIVSVLAESGNIIEYNINVFRDYAQKEGNTDNAVTTPGALKSSFELVEIDGIKYAIYSGKYTILEPDVTIEIPKGYKQGSLIITGISVTAYLPVDHEESEFILVYAKNELGDAGFYQYDRIEKTMQRYNPKSVVINESGSSIEDESALMKKYNTNLTIAAVIIALLAALSTFTTLISIRLMIKSKGHRSDDLD